MIAAIRIIYFICFVLKFDLARDSEEDKLYMVRSWKRPFLEEDKANVASKYSEPG